MAQHPSSPPEAPGPDRPEAEPADQPTLEAEIARERNPVRRVLKMLGPGLIAGASDDDPTAIATYTTAGAAFGYSTLWTALATFPLMAGVQFICAKVGLVSGLGLAGVIRRHYSRRLLFVAVFALLVANTINAGADIGAIAAGINLLVPIPISFLIVPVVLVMLALLVWGSYRLIMDIFKWLTLALFAYVAAAVLARPDPVETLRGTLIPTIGLDAAFLATLVAILGTNISPYLFFWQATAEVEEKVSRSRRRVWRRQGASGAELTYAAWDVTVGMFFSNLVVWSVNLAAAATLFRAGQTNVQTAADAAVALRPLAGDAAGILFAVGIIGSGFLAVPVLAIASAYAVSEAFGWPWGLTQNPARAKRFYGVIAFSTVVGMLINYLGISTIAALFWSSVVNGLLAPPLLVLIMLVANNREIMGNRVNGFWTNVLGWATTASMFAAVVGLVLTWGKT